MQKVIQTQSLLNAKQAFSAGRTSQGDSGVSHDSMIRTRSSPGRNTESPETSSELRPRTSHGCPYSTLDAKLKWVYETAG